MGWRGLTPDSTPAGRQPFFFRVYFSFLVFLRISCPGRGGGGAAEGWKGSGVMERILLVQAHGRALVHAHVGVAQQASGLALDALWIQGVQLLWGHFQVGLHLGTRRHLGDVETVLPSCKKPHARSLETFVTGRPQSHQIHTEFLVIVKLHDQKLPNTKSNFLFPAL